ncbi:TetR/AcrR family transcriptional regulator [Cystobacter ferrugineus]|uniref:TetR family transcriptional regulator n=1 Tax=Cystobacter ferrugineus TaxID=83449 RepID=A0A1L9BJU3_9BACT|nr:TetR/AcrR family transcriptional regulator [Cystobacter ferrugineus]OJH42594.1 TetR family transcriptional regulator [Cystobacter ferrugineus]
MTRAPKPPASKAAPRRRGASPEKTAATRRALSRAALDIFLERGFSATRMSDVATRAGLAKGTIYLHFTDKAALFEDVLREVMRDTLAGRPMQRPRRDETTRAFLQRVVVPVLRELQASGRFGVVRLVMAEGPHFPELAAVYRRVAIEPVLRWVRLIAARASARGELRSDALSRLPMLLVAPAVMAALWNGLYSATEPLDVASVFDTFLELLFVAPPPGRPRAARG